MTTDRLREAARVLRERAVHEQAILDEWGPQRIALGVMESPGLRLYHEFNATWTPNLALAVADWLATTAGRAEDIAGTLTLNNPTVRDMVIADNVVAWTEALAVADQILGAAS